MKLFKLFAIITIFGGTAYALAPQYSKTNQEIITDIRLAQNHIIVKKITDGDSLIAQTDEGFRVKLRLRDIDAPEKSQAFGRAAQKHLKSLCLNKKASYQRLSHDRYDRNLVRLRCGGVDVNHAMVAAGYAWVYDKYSQDSVLIDVETRARQMCKGLWKEGKVTPPWDFRKANDKRRDVTITPQSLPSCSQRLASL